MSFFLRHGADDTGLDVDDDGYVSIDALLAVLCESHPGVSETDVAAVIQRVQADKKRFSLIDGKVRANYGHSLIRAVQHPVALPPALLFHGTTEDSLPAILREGLRPMLRQYVHMTPDRSLANRTGARHGRPVVVGVDAERAADDGLKFMRANPVFWLTEFVPGNLRSSKRRHRSVTPRGLRLARSEMGSTCRLRSR